MIPAPSIGSRIRVQTKFGLREGTVVPNERWEKSDTFCMTGDEYIRVRNIALVNVVQIEYIKGEPLRDAVRAFRVKSTDGKRVYIVTVRGNKFDCNCVGFTYHHKCKHVEGVRRKING
jgi:hypothetical protein